MWHQPSSYADSYLRLPLAVLPLPPPSRLPPSFPPDLWPLFPSHPPLADRTRPTVWLSFPLTSALVASRWIIHHRRVGTLPRLDSQKKKKKKEHFFFVCVCVCVCKCTFICKIPKEISSLDNKLQDHPSIFNITSRKTERIIIYMFPQTTRFVCSVLHYNFFFLKCECTFVSFKRRKGMIM